MSRKPGNTHLLTLLPSMRPPWDQLVTDWMDMARCCVSGAVGSTAMGVVKHL
jgi:hypothetical protein